MNANAKTAVIILCLTLTCFLTQCESCLRKDKVTKKTLPDQVMYTISCGFPFPYFDVKVMTGLDEGFYYTVDCAYQLPVSMAVNIPALALIFSLITLMVRNGRLGINRLLAITVAITLMFDSSLLIPFFPGFFETVFGYLYVYPSRSSAASSSLPASSSRTTTSPRGYITRFSSLPHTRCRFLCSGS